MADPSSETIASLHFRHSGNWTADCTLLLRSDRRIQFVPSESLQSELQDLMGTLNTSALKWGASVVGILAVLGSAFYVKNRRGLAYTTFAASAMAGAAGYGVRRYSSMVLPWLLSPIPVDSVTLEWLDDDSLKISIKDGRLRRFTASLEPNEFERPEAVSFTEAFDAVRR